MDPGSITTGAITFTGLPEFSTFLQVVGNLVSSLYQVRMAQWSEARNSTFHLSGVGSNPPKRRSNFLIFDWNFHPLVRVVRDLAEPILFFFFERFT